MFALVFATAGDVIDHMENTLRPQSDKLNLQVYADNSHQPRLPKNSKRARLSWSLDGNSENYQESPSK